MKTLLLLIFLLFLLPLQAQQHSTFQFQLQVEGVSVQKGKSNYAIQQLHPSVLPRQAIHYFDYKKNFKKDSLVFEISRKDTFVFDLLHDASGYKMTVGVVSMPNSTTTYSIDLKHFYHPSKDIDLAVFLDFIYLDSLLGQQDSIYWKGCSITQTSNNNQHRTVRVQVRDYGMGNAEGLYFYAHQKLPRGQYDSYSQLKAEDFFIVTPNASSGKLIEVSNKQGKSTVVAIYHYHPTFKERKQLLGQHQAIYTFYDNHTFTVEIHNPPPEVSLLPARQDGIGIWEVEKKRVLLYCPPHWLGFFDDISSSTHPLFSLPFEGFAIRGKKLRKGYDNTYQLKLQEGKSLQTNFSSINRH